MRFGNVVKYRGEEYVYLVATDEIIYLAKIPNKAKSREAIGLRNKVFKTGSNGVALRLANTAWCFIVLSTEKFKDRIAHYGRSGEDYNPEYFIDIIDTLNTQDQKKLKQEIIGDPAVAKGLRVLVGDIMIEEV